MKKITCLLALLAFSVLGCSNKNATEENTAVKWEDGHPVESVKNCAICHEATRPTNPVTKVITTESGRKFTVHFHTIKPTGFNEDPGISNDCSTCHSHKAGWNGGNFGPIGSAHLTDSRGKPVSECRNCHEFPDDFMGAEHSMSKNKNRDCSYCHLVPGDDGATLPGGFGSFKGNHLATNKNCARCHEAMRPTSPGTKVMTTPDTGRNYTVHFHAIVPTGFNEDPAILNDCSTCHQRKGGWKKTGNFGPVGGPHLTDSRGVPVSRCRDCHDYPANFLHTEHTTSLSKNRDCSYCHLVPGDEGATLPGGFNGF